MSARRRAHSVFDQLWKKGIPKRRRGERRGPPPWHRNDAYWWLSKQLEMRREDVHMFLFNEEQCEEVIRIVTSAFPWTKEGLES